MGINFRRKKKESEPKKYIQIAIPLKEFRNPEFALSMRMFPRPMLESWGFDPDREITWWDDNIEQKRILVQEIIHG